MVSCPSVCPSVTLVDCNNMRWKYSKIISRTIILTFLLSVDPNITDPLQREHPELRSNAIEHLDPWLPSCFSPSVFPSRTVLRSELTWSIWPIQFLCLSWNVSIKEGKKVKVWILAIALLTETRTAALYNLGSGSWLAWADDTAAHYAAIHCPRQRTIGPAVQHDRYTTSPISHTRPSPRSP